MDDTGETRSNWLIQCHLPILIRSPGRVFHRQRSRGHQAERADNDKRKDDVITNTALTQDAPTQLVKDISNIPSRDQNNATPSQLFVVLRHETEK